MDRCRQPRATRAMAGDGDLKALWMVALLVLFAESYVQSLPLSMIASSTPDVSSMENVLESSAALSLQSQRVVLNKIGETFVSLADAQCSVFGGKESCINVPKDTPFSRLCGPSSNKTVDCAFHYEALAAVYRDPHQKLEKEGYTGCGECLMALQNFWCAQTIPACGSFDHVVDELLPVVASVATKRASALAALKESVPRIFQAASLALPCRRMCNAITNTCGCGHSHTFGEVMTMLQKDSRIDVFNVSMSPSTAKEIFVGIWHKPVCDIFAEEDTPGFNGVCQHVSDNSKCDWCKRRARPTIFYEQVVVQLSQMFYGMMQNGLQQVLKAAAGGKGTLQDNWSQSLSNGEVSQARHTGVVVLLMFLLMLAVGAFVAAVRAHRHRQIPSQYIDLNSMGYTPPML